MPSSWCWEKFVLRRPRSWRAIRTNHGGAAGTSIQGRSINMKQAYQYQVVALVALAALLVIAVALLSGAQTAAPVKSAAVYNSATEVTMNGSVEIVEQISEPQGRSGIHLNLKADQQTIEVHVGPSWFLTQNKISFVKGDQIEVTGSKVKFGNSDVLIAREIKKGENTITLRDARGIPAWSRGRRGR